jgi:hypothetical protein
VSESGDLRQFIHEITLRMERVLMAQLEETRAHFERTFEEHDRMFAHLEDLREESRAQRGALLALIDEMRGGGPAPAT